MSVTNVYSVIVDKMEISTEASNLVLASLAKALTVLVEVPSIVSTWE